MILSGSKTLPRERFESLSNLKTEARFRFERHELTPYTSVLDLPSV
jgi:hypothetical protein